MTCILSLLRRSEFFSPAFLLYTVQRRQFFNTQHRYWICSGHQSLLSKFSALIGGPINNVQFANFQSSKADYRKEGIFKRVKRKVYDSLTNKSKVTFSATLSYENFVDSIDWNEFIHHFKLPDTLQSWFLAVQLHVWMCIVVTIPEKQGRLFRNILVDTMWHDVEQRVDQLAVIKSSNKKKYLSEMLDQFQAALISYDEGILGDDTDLAASAWRTLFCFQSVDPLLLEEIVLYIRKQMFHLDSMNMEGLLFHGQVSFLPLSAILQEVEKERKSVI